MKFAQTLAWLGSLLVFGALTVGCATTSQEMDNYTPRTDIDAVQQMEWNLDPWR